MMSETRSILSWAKHHVFSGDNLLIGIVLIATLAANRTIIENLKKSSFRTVSVSQNNLVFENNVVLPDDIKRKWPALKLKIRNNVSGSYDEYTVNVGGDIDIASMGLKIGVKYFVPDFKREGTNIKTASDQPNNPAAMIAVLQSGREIYSGWVYKNNPSLNTFTHGTFDIVLGDGIVSPDFKQAEQDSVKNVQVLNHSDLKAKTSQADATKRRSVEDVRAAIKKDAIINYLNEGNSFHQMGRYDDAIEKYKRVLEIDPGNRLVMSKIESSKKAKEVEGRLKTLGK